MSAIWGAVSLDGTFISDSVKELMCKCFHSCVLDRCGELSDKEVYMGCGIQYFTKESVHETLPCGDEHCFFTADVVLDNRESLGCQLGISDNQLSLVPDGQLLLKMFDTHRDSCLNELLGAYSFVYYDKQTRDIYLVIDAVGDRCLYYCILQNTLYFSSLLEPLVKLTEAELNDRWITDFLAMDHLFMISEAEETPFQNIFRVAPAHCVRISEKNVHKFQYWNPAENRKELHLKNDSQYMQAFLDVFGQAVHSALRSAGPVSILLSGGMDSTAVACLASSCLKEKGETLYSYTSVPLSDYPVSDMENIDDESDNVKKTAAFLGNIQCTFISLPGINAWNGRKGELAVMEMPYKSALNMLWIPECMRSAYSQGSRLMLTGSYGNTTISYSGMQPYMSSLLTSGRLIRLLREMRAYHIAYGFSRKTALKKLLQGLKNARRPQMDRSSLYGRSFVRSHMTSRTHAGERLGKLYHSLSHTSVNIEDARHWMFHPLSLRQIGEVATKHSLATGVLLRDPTKDKRVIEFCMSLPASQFCKNGQERRLVSEYMRHLMPPHILSQSQKKGRQSADFAFRLSKNWEEIRGQWLDTYKKCLDSAYVDCAMARKELLERPSPEQYSVFDLTRHIYTLFMLEYEAYVKKTRPSPNTLCSCLPDKPLISVIVPVYNAKDYLQQCIQSILGQTYPHLQIILVDDGSTDGSGEICDACEQADPRICVIHKENAGVSSARNAGMELARGELMGFVDSDDWLEPAMYETLLGLIKEFQADVACCSYKKVGADGVVLTDFSDGETCVFHGAEMLETYVTGRNNRILSPAVWNRLFTRELLEGIRFPPMKKFEDQLFTIQTLKRVKKGVFLNTSLYNYRQHPKSLTRTEYGYRDLVDFTDAQKFLFSTLQNHPDMDREIYDYAVHTCHCILLDTYIQKCGGPENRKSRKLIKRNIYRNRKAAIRGLRMNKNIRRRDKLFLAVSTYSISAYCRLNGALKKYNRLKRRYRAN